MSLTSVMVLNKESVSTENQIFPGNLFMVVAPSGAGKSSLVSALLLENNADNAIRLSISHTTRSPRPGEENGVQYHFISVESFKQAEKNGDFLEWAKVHGNYYGTSRHWINEQMEKGHDVLLEIDWQGANQVRTVFKNAVSIFILPPSIEILKARLKNRGQDSDEVIARRVFAAHEEITHAVDADYVVINDDFRKALNDLQHIVAATRLRFSSQRARNTELFSELGIC
jgi:guanylate kinase